MPTERNEITGSIIFAIRWGRDNNVILLKAKKASVFFRMAQVGYNKENKNV